jgi:hypothetical protein
LNAKLIVDIPSINWACTYPLDAEKVQSAGRGKHNAVEVPDLGTSDRHAEFYFSMGAWHVREVGGEGDLRVNGRVLHESVLTDGDEIRIGNSQMLFSSEEEQQEEETWKRAEDFIRSESERVRARLAAAAEGADDGAEAAGENGQADDQPQSIPSEMPAASNEPIPHTKPKLLQPLHARRAASDTARPEAADDLVWVTRELASLLEDVLARPASLEFVFQRILMRLREAINADYGFLMIPDEERKRWVVRTQVGDALSWTGYERAHPVPLSVATTAFKRKRVVSNAMADDDSVEDIGPSASMIALRVNGYIAVPLVKGDKCRGVLYFDTRDGDKEFRARDVKLLARAGATMVEIEDRKRA